MSLIFFAIEPKRPVIKNMGNMVIQQIMEILM